MSKPWYAVENIEEISGPALLVFPERIERNIGRMIAAAGGTERLRPHVKTHKMAEVVRLKLAAGITKLKAATIAEAELCASCGAPNVLLSFPQTGPNVERLVRLTTTFPNTHFATLTDDEGHALHLSTAFAQVGRTIEVWLDLDVGQHRSGIVPDERAVALYRRLHDLPGTVPGGLHVYDGQVRDQDLGERVKNSAAAFESVAGLMKRLHAAGLPMQRPICGGTPTFPVHSRHADRDCSPGTCVLFDISYATKFPDLEYEFAAVLIGRVVSKPGGDRLCVELGYKSVSPDNPTTRIELLDVPDVKVLGQWEEHLTIETPAANRYSVGDVVYGVPYHVCPTVALHREAYTVRNGRIDGVWQVAARDRRITI